jgi:hypothetical protein
MAIVIALGVMAAWPATAVARTSVTEAAAHQSIIKLLKRQHWKSQSVINFWNNRGHWALHVRHDKCREVKGKKRSKVCAMARRSLRFHTQRLPRIEARIEKLTAPKLEIGILDHWVCIHRHEGAWNANTGNGYYGGLQMDKTFQQAHGLDFYLKKGTANNWTPKEQMAVAERAKRGIRTSYNDGRIRFWQDRPRGYGPWPNTARYCGLLR